MKSLDRGVVISSISIPIIYLAYSFQTYAAGTLGIIMKVIEEKYLQ